jgi:aspartate kinase
LVLLNISKVGLDNVDYITADILQILKENHIPLEHISTGIDDISLFVENNKNYNLDKVIEEIEHKLDDKTETQVSVKRDIALACLSGNGMKGSVGVFAKAATILSENHINIISTSQPASERNIIFFVLAKDVKKAVQVLYNGFIK